MRRLATLLTLILVAAACRASAAEHKLFAWRVAGDPGTVYLLGSIHVGKPDLYPLPQPIEQAFAVSPELVKEIDTRGSNLALLQQQVLQRGLDTGGDKLENHLSPPTRAALVQAWRTGDTAGMEATATRAVREHPELQPLIEALVYQRNAAMARQVADFLKTPKTRFVVVGSLHLVGDRGILKLLADKGGTGSSSCVFNSDTATPLVICVTIEGGMLTVSLAHAEARLSELTDKIENGEEVVITRRGRPAARLGPIEPRRQPIDVKAMGAYTLSNRGTWLSFGKTDGGLTVLIEGAPTRNDIY